MQASAKLELEDAIDHAAPCIVFDIPLLVESGPAPTGRCRDLLVDCIAEVADYPGDGTWIGA
jgi:plasmid stabilization system protein ParE